MATKTMANATAVFALLMAMAAAATPATGYTNHTVGGPAGWFFNSTTNTTSANYSAWTANETFNLGDYLIFNMTTNETVIQTYNLTTYQNCSMDDSLDSDTFQYDGGSNQFDQALTVTVPLTKEGPNYFFSDADDGFQCQHGMAFEIKVAHGIGLPPSLNQPPPPPYVAPPSPDSDGPSPPITLPDQPSDGGLRAGANVRLAVCILFWIFTVVKR